MKVARLKEKANDNRAVRFVRSFFEQFNESTVTMLSNGMVYSTLIALVPCLAVIYTVLDIFGLLDPVIFVLEEMLLQTFGEYTGANLVGYLRMFTQNAMGMSIISILSFTVTFVLLIDKLFTVVSKIYHTPKEKNLLIRYLKYMGIILVSVTGIVIVVYAVGRFNSLTLRLNNIRSLSRLQIFIRNIVPIAVVFAILLAMICLIPNCKVNLFSGVLGAATGTAGVTLLSMLFKFVVSRSVKYSVIYGSLAALMFFFMFLSYFWKIVFSSVIISYVHQSQTVGIDYEI